MQGVRGTPAVRAETTMFSGAMFECLLDACGVRAGSDVLEIGTGSGELCVRAARRGARVRSITVSVEQQHLARRRVAVAGLSDRVSIELLDYRAVGGQYDAVVSVDMIGTVGHRCRAGYLQALDRLVRPDGRVTIQAVTTARDRIRHHVCSGPVLPSEEDIAEIALRHTGLRTVELAWMRPRYARMVGLWDSSLSEACFSSGHFDALQWTFAPVSRPT